MAATKLAFVSDIHHYSPTLGTTGRAYELRSGSDQKCLAESGAITDAAFDLLAKSDVDAVVVSGDVSNDGEQASHNEFIEKVRRLQKSKPVYLITSTHDWCTDGNPRRFVGNEVFRDVPTYDAEALDALYAPVGREALVCEYETGRGFHSRCFQVSPTLRLLAVNDDMDGEGGRSGYSEAHLLWMEAQIKDAKEKGMDVVATEHHLMLWGISGLINKGQSISDNFAVAERLADAGLRLLFVGHSHMQRTTEFVSKAGNKLTQVNVGSLTGHPAPINFVTIEDGQAEVTVEPLREFTYEGQTLGADYIRDHSTAVLTNVLHAAATDKNELRDRLGAHGIRVKPLDKIYFLVRHFARLALRVTVGGAGRRVNALTFGTRVNRKAVRALKKEPLLPLILQIFLCVFDGSASAKTLPAPAKVIATDVSTLPRRVVRKLPLGKARKEKLYKTFGQIEGVVKELLYPSAPDNQHCFIDLK